MKKSFYDDHKCEWDMHFPCDLVMCLCDSNGNVCRYIDGFYRVHGGFGVRHRKLEEIMLLEFCLEKELCVHT